MKIYKGFIETNGKKPVASWTDDSNLSAEFNLGWISGAGVLNDGVVLLDFDDEESFDVAYKIVQKKGFKPKLNHNNHHMIFKLPDGNYKRTTHQVLACGIECDFLVNSLECLKKDGNIRYNGINDDIDTLDTLPPIFYPLTFGTTSTWNNVNFKAVSMKDGDGRYELLYQLRLALSHKGFKQSDITDIMDTINTMVFKSPISANNWERLVDFKAIREDEKKNYVIYDDKGRAKFLAYTFVIDQIEKLHATKHNGEVYGYVNGKWHEIYDYMDTLVTRMFKDDYKTQYSILVKQQLNSLIKYDLTIDKAIDWNNPRYTSFINGCYDWQTGEFIENEWYHYQTVQVPYEFNPNASSTRYDTLMSRIFGDDLEQKQAVLEVLGSGFYKNNAVKKKFTIFYGAGDNAKSLLTDSIMKICGDKLVSGVTLTDINTNRFALSAIHGKLFNIVDDANADYSGDTGKLKTICTGGMLQIEQKGKDSYTPDEPIFATIILNSNKLIRIGNGEDAYAIRKRRNIIYFTRQFKSTDEDYDPNACIDALNDPSFLQTLLLNSILAFKQMLHRTEQKFTSPVSTTTITAQFDELMTQSQDIIKQFNAEEWCKFNLLETYEFYKSVCGTNKPKSMIAVKNMIKEIYPNLHFSDEYNAFYGDEPIEDMNYLLVKAVYYPPTTLKSEIEKDLKYKYMLEIKQSKIGGFKSQRLKKCT